MHKDFYVSGFLYNLSTEQILLQQQKSSDETSSMWSLFREISKKGETPETVTQRIFHKLLRIKLDLNAIFPIYTYFDKEAQKEHAITYAHVEKTHNFSSTDTITYTWFTFKQVFKLPLSEQTKHNITVGQRVINAQLRKSLGQQTLE